MILLSRQQFFPLFFIVAMAMMMMTQEAAGAALRNESESAFFCLETLEDFETGPWFDWNIGNKIKYAKDSSELPEGVTGRIRGEGIFYYTGSVLYPTAALDFMPREYPSGPIFVYIRYYSHMNVTPMGEIVIKPALNPDKWSDKYLNRTSDFIWAEQIIEIDTENSRNPYLDAFLPNYNHVFLIDTIIVTVGQSITNIHDMTQLCMSAGQFKCTSEGFFPDRDSCADYHVCTPDGLGDFTDQKQSCPSGLVWCQNTLGCDYQESCPCTN